MKKKLLLLATLVFALTLCVSFAVAGVAVADNSVEWTVRDSAKDGYTVNADGTITAGADNNGWNFLLCDSYIATGDYSVTAAINGNIASPSDGSAQLGIVPWYIDGSNYIVVYAEWWAGDRVGQMKCVQITGLVNGTDLGWDDRWADGVTASPADGIQLVVTKESEKFSFSLKTADGNTELKSGDKTISGLPTTNAQIGIYGNGDSGAKFAVSTTLAQHTHDYQKVDAKAATTSAPGNIKYYTCEGCDKLFVKNEGGGYIVTTNDAVIIPQIAESIEWSVRDNSKDGYTVNADGTITAGTDNNGWNFLLCDSYIATGDYSVTAVINGNIASPSDGSAQLGIVPWYIDGDNYVVIYAEWWAGDRAGQMKCVQITGRVNGTDLGWNDKWTDGVTTSPKDGVKLVVTKEGEKFSFILYNADGITTLKADSLTASGISSNNAKFGIYGNGDNGAKFAVTTNLPVHTHDYETSTKYASDGENHYKVCTECGAKDTANKVACSGGEATCKDKAICDVCQNAYGSVDKDNHKNVGSEYSKDATGHWYVCADCEGKVGFEGHTSSGPATETVPETCTECGYEISPVLSHVHDYKEVKEEASTCQKQGHDTYYTCSGCDKLFVLEGEDYVETTLAAVTRDFADHDFENSTNYASDWENHWKICANCDEEDTDHKEAHAGGEAGLNSYAECTTCGHKHGTTTSDWQVTDRNNAGYTDLENNSVKYDGSSNQDITDKNNKGAFFIDTKSDASGNFTLSASILGTSTQESAGYIKAGLIPWYLDEDNYVIVWVQWWEERSGVKEMRNAQITAYIDGTFQGWENIWCDGITVAPADGIKLVIAKSGSTFAVELQKADGSSLKSGSKSFALADGDAHIGVYALGDELTYSNIELKAEGSGDTPVIKELWEKDGDKYISNNNTSQYGNFYFLDNTTVLGNSTISVDLKGTMTLPNSKTVNAGVVPWYIDENNYIYVYVEWHSSERPSDIRNIEITGQIDGKSFYRLLDGAYVEKQWNDIWCDGIHISAETGVTLKVETKLSQNGDAVEITVAILNSEGNVVKSDVVTLRDIVKYASVPAKVGLYAYNDTFTFSNISVVNNTDDNRNFKSEGSFVANGADWSEQDGVYSVDASDISSLTNNMAILSNALTSKSYSISMNVALSDLRDANGVGMLVWYVDHYNYLYAYVEGEYIGFKGVYTNGLGVELSQRVIDQKVAYTGGNITSLNVVKRAGRFVFMAGGQSVDISVDEMLDSANYGMLVYGASAQFSDIKVEKVDFNAFDTVSDNLGGKDYQISAKEENSITYDEGNFTISADAIDQTGEKLTSVVWSTSYFDIAGISAKFTVLNGGVYGFYPWYINSTNYVLVKVSTNNIEVSAQFGEWSETKSINLPDAFLYAGEHTLEAKLNLGKLSLELDGQALDIDFTAQGIDYTLSPKIGIVASVEALTVADVEVEGFKQRDIITDGDWDFRGGAHADTWTLNEDGSVSGKLTGGTQWQGTLALQPIDSEKKDYYTSATILVNEVDASEYKTGILPWYVDGNNYVFVWLSKWSDGSPCIVVTAKINGKAIGNEWREAQVAYNYVGETNYVEVKIEGNEIAVYLNKSFNPTFTTTVEGLSDRSMENSYAGLNISNTSALFGNITLQSDVRKFVLTEKPVITLVTTPATTGTIGTRVKLAIASVSSSSGETLSAIVKVLDPNGNEVAVSTGAFTPEIEGTYTITYTCTDMWGNAADAYSYTVTVGETGNQGGDDSSQGGNDVIDNPSEGSNALAIGLGVGIPVAVIAIAAVVVIILKRKGIILKRKDK